MAAAEVALTDIGMDVVAEHEADLTRYALTKLAHVKGVHLFGERDPGTAASRLGVIPLNLDGVSHFLLASILGFEFGIGVRNGCFCAHPYVLHLMDVDHDESTRVRQMILSHD
jgi:selenocysteine lyase/cysteine desulfurase